MPTKYIKRRQRNRSRKSRNSKKSRYSKMRGGALSARTIELLKNQYNGINRDRNDSPTIIELNQFLIDNGIPESLREVMDNIIDTIGAVVKPLPPDATPEQKAEEERLHAL